MKPAPENFRLTPEQCQRMLGHDKLGSTPAEGNNGCFMVPYGKNILRCIVSDQMGWEHVSTSLPTRCPTWEEMCFIKETFWDPEEECLQFHPKRSEYVNCHPYTLHIWRPTDHKIISPPSILVGFKS